MDGHPDPCTTASEVEPATDFQKEAKRQMLAIAESAGEAEDQAFVDAVSMDVWETGNS